MNLPPEDEFGTDDIGIAVRVSMYNMRIQTVNSLYGEHTSRYWNELTDGEKQLIIYDWEK